MGKQDAVAPLRVVAAVAENLANNIATGALWPGQARDALAQIEQALQQARAAVGADR